MIVLGVLAGVLIGIVLSSLIVLSVLVFRQPVDRTLAQVASRLKAKGSLIEPGNEEIESWVQSLPEE